MIHWSSGGTEYWAVSDLNQQELQEFVSLIQTQTARAPTN
jgi:anti-sigma factor RsiW